jgi:hypothetical protein
VDTLYFACGSAAGAALAGLVGRRDRGRLVIAALSGLSCGLLGIVLAMSNKAAAPATETCLGLLSTAVPLTLCVPSVRPAATNTDLLLATWRFATTLLLAIVYGISCATVGFVSVPAAREMACKLSEADHHSSSVVEMTRC